MKTYLVTGGAGFIGSNFIHYMFDKYQDEITIINVDCLTYAGNLENLDEVKDRSNYIFYKVDIRDHEKVEEIFAKHDIDYVIHFAAESHVDRSIIDPNAFVTTNVLGTMNLLNAAKQVWKTDSGFIQGKKYLQVSTDEVYGALEDEESFFYETTPLNPHSPYSASKASADFLVKSYYDTFGFPINITRCSNNYGPYQFPEKLIPLVINNALNGKTIPLYGTGKNVRDWLYVMDHAKAIDMVVNQGKVGEVYNVGGHNEKQNIDIIKIILNTIRNVLDPSDERLSYINEQLITYVPDRKGHDFRYAIAPDKIGKELSWQPETTFEVGIEKTIRWYITHNEWMEHITKGAYQDYYEKMYSHRE